MADRDSSAGLWAALPSESCAMPKFRSSWSGHRPPGRSRGKPASPRFERGARELGGTGRPPKVWVGPLSSGGLSARTVNLEVLPSYGPQAQHDGAETLPGDLRDRFSGPRQSWRWALSPLAPRLGWSANGQAKPLLL